MKIGIIVWSVSGHTLSVAEGFSKCLAEKGHSVTIERIAISGDPMKPGTPWEFTKAPKTEGYDALVFGAYVEAFNVAAVMKKYLADVADLSGKKCFVLVTQGLPKAWMGANHAVRQIKGLIRAKGGIVCDSAIVSWGNKAKDLQILEACDKAVKAF
mgnify:CR=1 FL=1